MYKGVRGEREKGKREAKGGGGGEVKEKGEETSVKENDKGDEGGEKKGLGSIANHTKPNLLLSAGVSQ